MISKIQPGEYIQTQYGHVYKRVEGKVGGQDAYVEIKKGKEGKRKTSIHDTVDFDIVEIINTTTKDHDVIDLVEKELWDHYSGLPNPSWYDKDNWGDKNQNKDDRRLN